MSTYKYAPAASFQKTFYDKDLEKDRPKKWVLNMEWWTKWTTHIGVNEGEESGVKFNDKERLDNSCLTEEGGETIKAGLEKDKDFVLVSAALWKKFDDWFGVVAGSPLLLWRRSTATTERPRVNLARCW